MNRKIVVIFWIVAIGVMCFAQDCQLKPISIEHYPGFECYRPMSDANPAKLVCYQVHDADITGPMVIPPFTDVYFRGTTYVSCYGGLFPTFGDRIYGKGGEFVGDAFMYRALITLSGAHENRFSDVNFTLYGDESMRGKR